MLGRFPLIDGHNDLPWALRERTTQNGGDLSQVVFDLDAPAEGLHTDLPRLAAGGVGAQFWSVYVPASLAGDAAVTAVLEQIDLACCAPCAPPRPSRPTRPGRLTRPAKLTRDDL